MSIPFNEKPVCTVREACEAGSIGMTTVYRLIGEGQIETVRIGTRTLVKVPSLLKLLREGADPRRRQPPVRRGPRKRSAEDVREELRGPRSASKED